MVTNPYPLSSYPSTAVTLSATAPIPDCGRPVVLSSNVVAPAILTRFTDTFDGDVVPKRPTEVTPETDIDDQSLQLPAASLTRTRTPVEANAVRRPSLPKFVIVRDKSISESGIVNDVAYSRVTVDPPLPEICTSSTPEMSSVALRITFIESGLLTDPDEDSIIGAVVSRIMSSEYVLVSSMPDPLKRMYTTFVKMPLTLSSSSQPIDAASSFVTVFDGAKPPSFDIRIAVAYSGHTGLRMTFFVLVNASPFLIEIPISPVGGDGRIVKVRETSLAASHPSPPL